MEGPRTPGLYSPLRLYSLYFLRLYSLLVASRLSLAEAKSQRGTARSTLAIEPGTALPFTAETPLPRKAKNAPARRRVPQMAKNAQARRSLALHGRNSLAPKGEGCSSQAKSPPWPCPPVALQFSGLQPLGEFAQPTEDPLMGIKRL